MQKYAVLCANYAKVYILHICIIPTLLMSATLSSESGRIACEVAFPSSVVHSWPVAPCVPPCFFPCLVCQCKVLRLVGPSDTNAGTQIRQSFIMARARAFCPFLM